MIVFQWLKLKINSVIHVEDSLYIITDMMLDATQVMHANQIK